MDRIIITTGILKGIPVDFFYVINDREIKYVSLLSDKLIGAVCLGMIDKISESPDGAFVLLESGKDGFTGFLPAKNFDSIEIVNPVEKVDRKKKPLVQGDLVAVRISGHSGYRKCYSLEPVSKEVDISSLSQKFDRIEDEEYRILRIADTFSAPAQNVSDIRNDDDLIREYALTHKTDSLLMELTEKRVYLKNGAYILIEECQTATLIDVNSGKAIGKSRMEINKLAAKTIIDHIRLRHLSGMILVDFLRLNKNEERLLSTCIKDLIVDDPYINFFGFSKLGLAEFTVKRTESSIDQQFYKIKMLTKTT